MMKALRSAPLRHSLLAVLTGFALICIISLLIATPLKQTFQNAQSYHQKTEKIAMLQDRLSLEREASLKVEFETGSGSLTSVKKETITASKPQTILANFQQNLPTAKLHQAPKITTLSDELARNQFTLSISGDNETILTALRELSSISASIEQIQYQKISPEGHLEMRIYLRSYQLLAAQSDEEKADG